MMVIDTAVVVIEGMQHLCGQFTFMWMDINRIDFWMILIEKNRSDQG